MSAGRPRDGLEGGFDRWLRESRLEELQAPLQAMGFEEPADFVGLVGTDVADMLQDPRMAAIVSGRVVLEARLRRAITALQPAQAPAPAPGGQGVLTAELLGRVLGQLLHHSKQEQVYDGQSSRSAFRTTLKQRVKEYYGTEQCMVTGAPWGKCKASHILPASLDYQTRLQMTEGFREPFDVNSARNALLLCDDLHRAWEDREVFAVYNPLSQEVFIKALSIKWQRYDGQHVRWANRQALPYRKALKMHFEMVTRAMGDQQRAAAQGLVADDQWDFMAEMSARASQDGDGPMPRKFNPVWICQNTTCEADQPLYECYLSCPLCFHPRYPA